jgi:hypothetical protein
MRRKKNISPFQIEKHYTPPYILSFKKKKNLTLKAGVFKGLWFHPWFHVFTPSLHPPLKREKRTNARTHDVGMGVANDKAQAAQRRNTTQQNENKNLRKNAINDPLHLFGKR